MIYKKNEHILKSEYGDAFLACVCYEWKFPRFVAHNSASEQSVWRHLKSLLRECQGCTHQLSWKNAQEGENKNNRSAFPTVLSTLDSFMWKIKSCLCKCFTFQVSPLRLRARIYFCYLKQSMSFSTFQIQRAKPMWHHGYLMGTPVRSQRWKIESSSGVNCVSSGVIKRKTHTCRHTRTHTHPECNVFWEMNHCLNNHSLAFSKNWKLLFPWWKI